MVKDGIAIAGATSPSYAIDPVASVNGGSYYAVVSNALGYVTSAPATLTVSSVDGSSNTALVVAAANAFLDTLTRQDQKSVAALANDSSTVLFGNIQTNAVAWSHLVGNRHGLRLNASALSATQLNAANALIAGPSSSAGATQVSEIRLSDDVMVAAMPASGAGANLYSIAFVGQPSLTQGWTLQLQRPSANPQHHLQHQTRQRHPHDAGRTASQLDLCQRRQLCADKQQHRHTACAARNPAPGGVGLATAVQASTVTASAAKLSVSISDLMFAPAAQGDLHFKALSYPSGTSDRGVLYGSLSSTQQAAVKAMIEAWVGTQAADVADNLLAAYESDTALATTYVAYAPGTGGTADFGAFPQCQCATARRCQLLPAH